VDIILRNGQLNWVSLHERMEGCPKLPAAFDQIAGPASRDEIPRSLRPLNGGGENPVAEIAAQFLGHAKVDFSS